ncbi:MAG TPA: hypothetical protein ENO24_00165 [Chloroflexi bacterium]|nr:hypothetical protein [Chloroflexota bacterium]
MIPHLEKLGLKRWQSIAVLILLALMTFGPFLPDPAGHFVSRQWVHLGWAAAVWLMTLAGFEWVQRTGYLPDFRGWTALILPAACAWVVVALREMADLVAIIRGTLHDPWSKSIGDIAFWAGAIALWVWVTYRLAPRLAQTIEEIERGRHS